MSNSSTDKTIPVRGSGTLHTVAIIAVALFVAAPIFATVTGAFSAEATSRVWPDTVLRYFATTLALCVMTGIGVVVLGAGTALITTLADFPGRRLFDIALALPFAIPAYVAAYAYADFLGPFGPAAGILGASNLPEIRSLPGAAFILTLAAYPYVYLAMRASLAARSGALIEAARMQGATPFRASTDILLAVGRPALIGGLALALMETVADYGVADFFGVQTLSVGIFRTWYGLGDLVGATQVAAGLFLFALLLILIEEARRRGRSEDNVRAHRSKKRLRLSPLHAILAILACMIPVLFGFIIPAGVLLLKLDPELSVGAARGLQAAASNTAWLAIAGAGLATVIAVIMAYAARRTRSAVGQVLLRIATMGYAIPGAVIAIGMLALGAWVGQLTGIVIAGGIGVLLYAYVARFLTASFNITTAGLQQISPQMDAAAQTLGANASRLLSAIHLPQMRMAVFAGAAIVAIDIAKELPATLLLRSFNFETLSTHIYRLASDERLADAAPAALILIALGLLPVIAMTLYGNADRK